MDNIMDILAYVFTLEYVLTHNNMLNSIILARI